MSNYTDTLYEVKNYLAARTPLIIIDTSERERAERMLRTISEDAHMEIQYYTDIRQVEVWNGENSLNQASLPPAPDFDPLQYAATLFRKKKHSTFVLGDVKRISEDNLYTREIINLLYLAKESVSTLILITADRVTQHIAQFGMIAKLSRPDLDERYLQISQFAKLYGGRFPIEWDDNDRMRAAALLRGFTEIQIDNILSNAITVSKGLFRGDIFKLTAQKSKLYAAVASVDEIAVRRDLVVAGLDNFKVWLQKKKRVFFASDAKLNEFALETPKGVLLVGVPGCGKSYSAKMVAMEWELPLFRFDIGSIYDKWMGESERKMKEALDFIDNVSPCIVWLDEIEKGLAVSNDSNDTGKRILGQFLFWLQESKSRTFLVATANNTSLLPPELFRKGRFSEVFFMDLPGAAERESAIRHFNGRSLHYPFTDEELEVLVQDASGFSYAEIEYVMSDIAEYVMLNGHGSIDLPFIRERFREVVPIEQRDAESICKIREWGAERAVPASLQSKE